MSNTYNVLSVCAAAGLSIHLPVSAQSQSTLDGYKITAPVNVIATRSDDSGKKVCIPAKTSLVILRTSDSEYKVSSNSEAEIAACKIPEGTEAAILPGVSYTLSKVEVEKSAFAMRGVTYGALVIPFKYQLKGDKQFEGGASLGGYLGYRFETLHNIGITATPIAFMGASNISVKGATDADSRSLMGFSYGLGLVGTVQRSFQAGVVLGWDRVGRNEGYKYNGKPWLALQFGYAFLQ